MNSVLKRPIQRKYPLEISHDNDCRIKESLCERAKVEKAKKAKTANKTSECDAGLSEIKTKPTVQSLIETNNSNEQKIVTESGRESKKPVRYGM